MSVAVGSFYYTVGNGLVLENGAGPNWSIDMAAQGDTLPEDTYSVTALVIDVAGNRNLSVIAEVDIDQTAPNTPTVNEQLSNSGTPTITGTYDSSSSYVIVEVNGVSMIHALAVVP